MLDLQALTLAVSPVQRIDNPSLGAAWMGRRKERRLAAMAAAGRRVKLDLFVDPSPGKFRYV